MFTVILLIGMLTSLFSQKYEAKGICFVKVFSKDDTIAAPCVQVFKGYFIIYTVINLILRFWYSSQTHGGPFTRRSLKRNMRCMVFSLFPLLFVNNALLAVIFSRIVKLSASYEEVERFSQTAYLLLMISGIHGFYLSFEMIFALLFAARRATNKC